MKITAEPIAAIETALFETEQSLAALRIFTPSALSPKLPSTIAIMGSEHLDSVSSFTIKDSMIVSHTRQAIGSIQSLPLPDEMLRKISQTGLGILSILLQLEHLSEFQRSIMLSVTQYSQATCENNLENKMLYLLAALENLFIKNETEPIQQNLGERIAILIGQDLTARKAILRNLKSTYSLRSAFVHHARSADDYEAVESFMLNCWRALIAVIQNHERFATKEEFISAIDDRKLS